MNWPWFPPLSDADPHSLLFSIPLSFLISSIALALVLGIAAFFLEFVRKIGCKHSLERSTASDAFFEDPNSLKKVPCPTIFDPVEKYISLIVPAFNEEHRLPGALVETLNYLERRSNADKTFTYEVLIVDDGSKDKTSKVAFDFVRKYKIDIVRVILLGRNHGKGEAIRKIHALAETGRDHSSHKLSDTEVAVFGSRAHLEKQALATRKWYRNFLMKGFHLVVLLAAGPGIRDTQCGFKMFTRAAARKLFTNIRLKRWCFDVEIVYLCKHLNIPMVEVSVNWTEIPGSKVRLTSIMHMLFELVLIRLGYGLGIWKVYT